MINLKHEIETFLNSNWCNTNDKEQNMQGRLYAWLLRLEQQGYTVEMETSIHDAHLDDTMPEITADNKPAKTEMDIFISHKDTPELYAVELKWIYNKTEGWNVVDHLQDFEKDAMFCRWLAEKADFTETCSVVVYDFEESKQVKRYSPKERIKEKRLFLGKDYPVDKSKRCYIQTGDDQLAPFMWQKLNNISLPDRDYYYYIISFQNKNSLATKLAMHIEQIYGFDWIKCVSLVFSSSWWDAHPKESIHQANITEMLASICREIDNNQIQ